MGEPMISPAYLRPTLELPPMPYDYLLRSTAERYPTRPAILFQQQVISYRDLVAMVNRVAHGLRGLGIEKGERISLFTTNCPEYAITLNAASTIGAVVTPLSPAYKERELASRLLDSETKAIVVHHDLLPILLNALASTSLPALKHIIVVGDTTLSGGTRGVISFSRFLAEAPAWQPDPVAVDIDQAFILPYSSGTTGLPKGVMLSQRNLVSNHLQFLAATGIRETDSTVLFIPQAHIYGVMLTGTFLAAGATQVLVDGFDLTGVLNLCRAHGITWFFATPPVIQALANAPDLSQMSSVRYLMNAAASLPLHPARVLAERTGVFIVQGYGMIEASPVTHCSLLAPGMPVESVGALVSNTTHKIMDAETGMRELPVGEDGEVIIGGPQVMLGYWKSPEETARALRNGWLYTGDIGHIDSNGFLSIKDRKKEMIKYKGFSIAPAELEGLLLEHPAVLDAAVVGMPDEEAGEVPTGFVVLRPKRDASEEQLLAFVNGKLASHKKLASVVFLSAIPKIPAGKILRRELKEQELARRKQESIVL